jgi:hypothetical protein
MFKTTLSEDREEHAAAMLAAAVSSLNAAQLPAAVLGRPMRRARDPLALDPLGLMGIGPITDDDSPSGPLALDPLSPLESGARPADAHRSLQRRRRP